MPERVVFIDETSVKTNLTRIRGRSMRGTRLTASAPFGSWGTQTLIAGLSPSDLVAPWVIKGAMDGPAFVAYIRDVLIPEIEPGTAVVLDNLATHRNKEAEALLHAHGCWFLFLPPYSPDLNPIEMAFSKLKAHLRRIGARSFTGLFEALGLAAAALVHGPLGLPLHLFTIVLFNHGREGSERPIPRRPRETGVGTAG